MRAIQNAKSGRLLASVPLAFGAVALCLYSVYEAQRWGLLFYSFDRFVQHHLDGIAGVAFVSAILGALIGVVIIQFRGKNHLVTIGTLISTAAMFWCLLLPL
jgi:hypothetical protein